MELLLQHRTTVSSDLEMFPVLSIASSRHAQIFPGRADTQKSRTSSALHQDFDFSALPSESCDAADLGTETNGDNGVLWCDSRGLCFQLSLCKADCTQQAEHAKVDHGLLKFVHIVVYSYEILSVCFLACEI